MPKPTKNFEREVRRVRYLSGWLVMNGRADKECQILDVSSHGAKLVVQVLRKYQLASNSLFFKTTKSGASVK
jgi:hypothetical protein